jgi:hypothetical protein
MRILIILQSTLNEPLWTYCYRTKRILLQLCIQLFGLGITICRELARSTYALG